MGLNDGARNRQAHAHSIRLGCEKRIEDVREFLGGNAVPGVAHRDFDGSRGIHPRAHGDAPIPRAGPVQRVDAIKDEVEEDLLEMHAITAHRWQIRRQIYGQLHVPGRRVRLRELGDIADEFG